MSERFSTNFLLSGADLSDTGSAAASRSRSRLSWRLCILISAVYALSPCAAVPVEVPAEVQAALDWELPPNECEKPALRGNSRGVAALGGTISHSATNTTADTLGTTMLYDVDPVQTHRYEHQLKQWEACVRSYKTELLEHFGTLKASARFGLTAEQAEVIVGKLALIQAAVLSADGTIDEEAPTSR